MENMLVICYLHPEFVTALMEIFARKPTKNKLLIQEGKMQMTKTFARNFIEENKTGRKKFDEIRRQEATHPVEEVGSRLRAFMPFLDRVTAKGNGSEPAS